MDYWTSKCWLAYSLLWIAFPYKIIKTEDIFNNLEKIILENKTSIKKIVVWMPYNSNWTESKQSKITLSFINELKYFLENNFKYIIEIIPFNEKLSTEEARFIWNESWVDYYSKNKVDDLAAYVILRNYLDSN